MHSSTVCLHDWESFIPVLLVCSETLSWISCGVYANELIIRIEFKRET